MLNHKPNRDRKEIYAETLKACVEPKLKTQLMYQTNVSYSSLLRTVRQLRSFGLLVFEKGTRKYATTCKGKEYIKKWMALQELLQA